MKKNLNIITTLLLAITFLSCNKESIIQGAIIEPIVKSLNLKSSLYAKATSNPYILLDIEGNKLQFRVENYLLKGYATSVSTVTDSLRFTEIPTYSFTPGLVFKFCTTGGAVSKFNSGDLIPITSTSQSFAFITVGKKANPYTSSFTSINSSISGSPFNSGVAYTPQFALNTSAYIGFILSLNTNGNYTNYYGWIKITIGQNDITFDNYAYQLANEIKAGQEK